MGRSPRFYTTKRSIPAHAGEPTSRPKKPSRSGVYPRPRGGAWRHLCEAAVSGGLSPPTRGSHNPPVSSWIRLRSIPAHAGEPSRSASSLPPCSVYPRPRGGAQIADVARILKERSIPAHAGEPASMRHTPALGWVYLLDASMRRSVRSVERNMGQGGEGCRATASDPRSGGHNKPIRMAARRRHDPPNRRHGSLNGRTQAPTLSGASKKDKGLGKAFGCLTLGW